MILVEPQSVYAERMKQKTLATVAAQNVVQPRQVPNDNEDYWKEILLQILKLENLPVQISSLASSAAKWGDYGCRADRERRKLQLFKLVARLIREGVLRRHARNYVLLNPVSTK
jgi:hypothetical protein